MQRISMLLLIGAMAVMAGFGCEKLPQEPGAGTGPPAEYDGPETGLAMNLDRVDPDAQYELISDAFITDTGATDWFAVTINWPFTLRTYAGHWYNHCLTKDGVPFLGSGYTLAGVTPHEYWQDENRGIFASHMILTEEDGTPWIWQWPSNLSSLVDLNIQVMNWSTSTELGLVGTLTSYAWHPAELVEDGQYFVRTMRGLPGDLKLAVVDMGTRQGLGDMTTVWVNGVELTHYVTDFEHERHANVHRYYRFSVGAEGQVTPLGDENRRVYSNTLSVTTPHVDSAMPMYLEAAGLTNGERIQMTYQGSQTWSVAGLTSWVGLQDLRVIIEDGTPVFRTVRLNGQELVHLATVLLDPDPPIQVFRFILHHNHEVEQGEDNRTVDIGIGQ